MYICNTLSSSPLLNVIVFSAHFNTLPHTSSFGASDYALVPNTDTINKLDTLTRQRKAKQGSSPASTHSSTPDSPSVSGDSLYSPVRDVSGSKRKISSDHYFGNPKSHTPSPTPPPVHPKATIYDRLTPKSQKRKMIESQMAYKEGGQEEGLYSLANDDLKRSSDSTHHYSSFNNTQIQLEQLQNQFNDDMAEKLEGGGSSNSSLRRGESPTAIYDFADNPPATNLPQQLSMESYNVKTLDGSPTPQRRPFAPHIPPDYSSMPGDDHTSQSNLYSYASVNRTRYSIQTQSHEGTPDPIYSLAEGTPPPSHKQLFMPHRESSPMVNRSPTPPPTPRPPVPPRASPKPTEPGNYFSRMQTANRQSPVTPTKVRSSPVSTPPVSRATDNVTPSSNDEIYTIPQRKIPIQHVIANESIYALPDKPVGRKPPQREATPVEFDENDDDDDEEAPPLPPRNYDTSDIEARITFEYNCTSYKIYNYPRLFIT